MRLYHGSNQVVDMPEIRESTRSCDFGVGFYTTESCKQAEDWAVRTVQRRRCGTPYVSEYLYECSADLVVAVFDSPSIDWLNFVVDNRIKGIDHDFDIVVGPVADEGVYDSLLDYESKRADVSETIERLKTSKLDGQVLFHTSRSLGSLRYIRSWEVGDEKTDRI